MTANHILEHLQAPSGHPQKIRTNRSIVTHHYSTRRFSTTECARCNHTFLRYAAACPECGLVRRRRRTSKTKARAILCSAIAIALTCLFAAETNSNGGIKRSSPAGPALAAHEPTRPAANPHESGKVRYLVIREADLARMQFGPRIGAK